jgi:endoglucanase
MPRSHLHLACRSPRGAPTVARAATACWLCLLVLGVAPSQASSAPRVAPGRLEVAGKQLRDGAGQPVRLLGVNRAGTEYACAQGWGIFDGPHDADSVAAMRAWGINAVRVPLNEHCWLGLADVPAKYGGEVYQAAIRDWVDTLRAAGLYVILDLHWAAPAGQRADRLRPMPDHDYAPTFWREVATAYAGDGAVLFDLYNEPYPDNNHDTPEAWRCWRDGGACTGLNYQAAGMQELVDTVRSTGATNIILLGGVEYANSLSQYGAYAPRDLTGNLAASWHTYNFAKLPNAAAWDAKVGIPTANVPLVAGELGEDDCGTGFLEQVLPWLDARGASYLGWAWNTWGRCDGPVLITDYDGTPSTMGQALHDHLAQLGPASLAAPGETTSAPAAAPAAVATPGTANDRQAGALVLYGDQIAPPFWDGTFGANAKNPCDRQTHVEGRCAYALAFGSWGGLDIGRDDGFTTTGYARLEWAFNSQGQPLANFAVQLTALADSQAIRAIPLDQARVLADLGDGWLRLAVPLSDLNPEHATAYEVQIRNVSGHDLGTIYLDDLQLAPGGVGDALATGARAAGPDAAQAAR